MTEATLTDVHQNAKTQARQNVRRILETSTSYAALPVNEQKDLYLSLVHDEFRKELTKAGVASPNGIERSMATDSGADMGYKGYDPSFGQDTKAFKDLVQSVDFPKFVADLLKAVFDANLSVMKPVMGRNRLIERLFTVPEYEKAYREHVKKLTAGAFNPEKMNQQIDALVH